MYASDLEADSLERVVIMEWNRNAKVISAHMPAVWLNIANGGRSR